MTNNAHELGQYIPLHYHYNMLQDVPRMTSFKKAIQAAVRPGDTVLELGSGTGVLAYFAAQIAKKVICVEHNADLADVSRKLLAQNAGTDVVEVVHGDAFDYLPDEPVDVVICEMLHVGLLRERQAEIIHSFKERYEKKFPQQMPLFLPIAALQAVQPVQQAYDFEGFCAPIVLFQDAYSTHERTVDLGPPVLYNQILYADPYPLDCVCEGTIAITKDGTLNAIRVITKNLLHIDPIEQTTVDWHSQYLVMPLETPIDVKAEQVVKISFQYAFGAPLDAFCPKISLS